MATYEVTAPDGNTYEIVGNGSEAEALAEFQRQWAAQKGAQGQGQIPPSGAVQGRPDSLAAPGVGAGTGQAPVKGPDKPSAASLAAQGGSAAAEDMGWGERNLAAAGGALVQAGQGVRQFASEKLPQGWVNPPAEEDMARAKALGNAAPVGHIAGNLALTALPISRGISAVKSVASSAPVLARTLAALAVPAVSGASGALRPVVGDETRLGNVLEDAAGGVIGQGIGNVLSRALTGLISSKSITPAGRAIMEKVDSSGQPIVVPSIKGAAEGGIANIVNAMQSFAQFLGKKKSASRTELEVLDQIGREINPTSTANLTGRIGIGDWAGNTKHEFDRVFETLLKGRKVPLDLNDEVALKTIAQNALKNTPSRKAMGSITEDVEMAFKHADELAKSGKISADPDSAERWMAVTNYLTDRSNAATKGLGSYELVAMQKAFDQMKEFLSNRGAAHLPRHIRESLDAVKDQYLGFSVAKKVATNSPGMGVTGKDLITVAHKEAPEARLLAGDGKFQEWTAPLHDVMKAEGAPSSWGRRLGYGAIAGLSAGAGMLGGGPLLAAPALAAYGIGKMADTRAGAKFLMGKTGWQQALATAMRKNPLLGRLATAAGASTSDRNDYEE